MQLRHHEASFFVFIFGVVPHDLVATADVGPQFLRFALNVVRDHCVRSIKNHLCAAIVLRKYHGVDVGERPLKLQDVAIVGTAKCVNRLVGVANHTDVVVQATEQQHDFVLRQIGVLVLVNQHMLEAILKCCEGFWVATKQQHHVDQQVIEVHRFGAAQSVLVFGVDLGVLGVVWSERRVGGSGRLDQFVLPQADARLGTLGRKPLRVEVEVANDLPDESQRV